MKNASVLKQGLGLKNNYLSPVIALALLLSSLHSHAQYDSTKQLLKVNAYGSIWNNGQFLGSLGIPNDTIKLSRSDSNHIAAKNGALYVWTGYRWQAPSVFATTDSAVYITVTKLNDSLSRRLTGIYRSHDSVFACINGACSFAFRDSTGGGGSMVYPASGIPNSTGSAWGTSYSTTGTGTQIALSNSPGFTGNPTALTQADADSSGRLATTEFTKKNFRKKSDSLRIKLADPLFGIFDTVTGKTDSLGINPATDSQDGYMTAADHALLNKKDGWFNIVRDGGADTTGKNDVSTIQQTISCVNRFVCDS